MNEKAGKKGDGQQVDEILKTDESNVSRGAFEKSAEQIENDVDVSLNFFLLINKIMYNKF